jgi:hypothetical protein
MEQMVTISVKIPKALKERIKRSHIKVSKVVRALLEQNMFEEEAHKINEEVKKHKKAFDKLSVEEVVKSIREDRLSR